jgi:hypothetical protein
VAKPRTINLDEIRARAAAATAGPWHWAGNTDMRWFALAYWKPGAGRCSVMDFARWGMHSATPRFSRDLMMFPAHEKVVYEVAPNATRRADPQVYRADITGIRHPDAEFLAASRQDVDDLLAVIDSVRRTAEAWIDDMDANGDPCIEGVGCPCCHARDILNVLGVNHEPASACRVATVSVAGDVL